jgi:hypothetical protein
MQLPLIHTNSRSNKEPSEEYERYRYYACGARLWSNFHWILHFHQSIWFSNTDYHVFHVRYII